MRTLFLVLVVAACGGGGQSPVGGVGGACRPDQTCDPGLVCSEGFCVVLDAPIAGGDDSGKPPPFACADDGALEPNNSIQTAFQVPSQATISFAALSICPDGDQDFYRVAIAAANQTLDAMITLDGGDPVAAAILNAAATPIANATTDGPGSLRAVVPNLPAGTYFVRITSAGSGNYAMTLGVHP